MSKLQKASSEIVPATAFADKVKQQIDGNLARLGALPRGMSLITDRVRYVSGFNISADENIRNCRLVLVSKTDTQTIMTVGLAQDSFRRRAMWQGRGGNEIVIPAGSRLVAIGTDERGTRFPVQFAYAMRIEGSNRQYSVSVKAPAVDDDTYALLSGDE